jgi:MoxR-like ATPase
MEEQQVTIDGETRALPAPFFVIATQNPGTQVGTFPLPESQLDRFLMRIAMGYPDRGAERELLRGADRRQLAADVGPVMPPTELQALQQRVPALHIAAPLLDYVQALLEHTRTSGEFRLGLSPRAGLSLVRASQAWALMEGRDAVIPEDVQAVFPHVAAHRLQASDDTMATADAGAVRRILQDVPVP